MEANNTRRENDPLNSVQFLVIVVVGDGVGLLISTYCIHIKVTLLKLFEEKV